MNKIPRYMKEFADAQRESYSNNALMQKKYKNVALKAINCILHNTERGIVTINEGMQALCNPLDGICKEGGAKNAG